MQCAEEPTVMVRRSNSRRDDEINYVDRESAMLPPAELLRKSSTMDMSHKGEEKISVFWRVFGGTLLSITALVTIQVFQGLSGNIHELRTEISRLREQQADYVKKDDFGARTTSLWNRVQDLQSLTTSQSVLGNKVASLEQQLATAERDRKEIQTVLANVTAYKDRIDEHKKQSDADHKEIVNAGLSLNALREKDWLLEKQLREGETERKDLMRELQALRERIAKLEGTKCATESKKDKE